MKSTSVNSTLQLYRFDRKNAARLSQRNSLTGHFQFLDLARRPRYRSSTWTEYGIHNLRLWRKLIIKPWLPLIVRKQAQIPRLQSVSAFHLNGYFWIFETSDLHLRCLPLHAALPLKRLLECPLSAPLPLNPVFCPLRSISAPLTPHNLTCVVRLMSLTHNVLSTSFQ